MKRNAGACRLQVVLIALVAITVSACMTNVEYARPGQSLEPRDGKALVFSRIRFFYDRHEIFPWDASASVAKMTQVGLQFRPLLSWRC